MTPPGDAFEAGLRLARALTDHGVPYALGGALAYGQYGVPRATNDVDINVFVEPNALGPVVEALRALGIEVDANVARQQADFMSDAMAVLPDAARLDRVGPALEKYRGRRISDGDAWLRGAAGELLQGQGRGRARAPIASLTTHGSCADTADSENKWGPTPFGSNITIRALTR